jgi:hypothetical protein
VSALSAHPRPSAVVADDGTLTNPEGWSMVLVADDKETVWAGWTEAGEFHQWETTEVIVKQLITVLEQYQTAWGADVSGHRS